MTIPMAEEPLGRLPQGGAITRHPETVGGESAEVKWGVSGTDLKDRGDHS